ncbi:type II toxin-antitoxin system VapB family antitoxin [Roseateles oligotrophus]|uniref:Type II toxin-antitoxin system VapB family antitoxin n=1 Tax=Roseateles oligotrophus TaxID=1769250 RepID=A0ABT2YIB5_9BURK|nr:type II toxin-antitoxin system VapB family antitoxin [Roseateles oligotrophus]MCV2369830.1 type II toxin-antitoxin system VapB family antitoxin [Roseateles oligotrophus]
MRTNIEINDDLMDLAMKSGAFKTKKDAVEAGLRLLARQAAYREILALRGKLRWEDAPRAAEGMLNEPAAAYRAKLEAGLPTDADADAESGSR